MVYLALYKGKGSLFNVLIRAWTGSCVSHCELVVDGVCYSSSAMDKGVRSKVIDLDNGNWELVPLPWADKEKVIEHFEATRKYKYGYIGLVLNQLLNMGRKTKDVVFCSEWCLAALGVPCPHVFNPHNAGVICNWITDNQ